MYNAYMDKLKISWIRFVLNGGAGSGHFGHLGRPGEQGGSRPGSSGGASASRSPTIAGIKAKLLKDGGFTYHPISGNSPKTGFMVSPYEDREKIIPAAKITDKDLLQYVVDNRDLFNQSDHYFGGWVDEGKVYLDVSIRAETSPAGRKLAIKHKQLAYFDLEKGITIYVDPKKNPN